MVGGNKMDWELNGGGGGGEGVKSPAKTQKIRSCRETKICQWLLGSLASQLNCLLIEKNN